jgi:Uma2 family endonuclease
LEIKPLADGFQSSPDLNAAYAKRRSFSVAELDAMFDAQILSREEKIELIDGEIIQVNSQMMRHGVVKMRLLKSLLAQLPQEFDVSNEFTVELDEFTLVDPDVFVSPNLSPDRRYVQSHEVFLAIEVADTSLGYDLGIKATLYSRAKVPELWVIDVNAGETWVHREPGDGGYQSIMRVPFEMALEPMICPFVKVVVGPV